MICITPIAPALEVMGTPAISVRPPLSMRITARIQSSETPKRLAASLISEAQRSTAGVADLDWDFCAAAGVEPFAANAGFASVVAVAHTAASNIFVMVREVNILVTWWLLIGDQAWNRRN